MKSEEVIGKSKNPERCRIQDFLEVPPGFEPGNNGFADRGLTAWLWYHMERMTRLELATSTLARWRSTR